MNTNALLAIVCVIATTVALVCAEEDVPRGHMQPLGYHRDAEPPLDSPEGFLSAYDFWNKYVRLQKPVIFRRATTTLWPAYENWKTDKYLTKVSGKKKVKVEQAKKENRVAPDKRMYFSRFLREYMEKELYITGTTPTPLWKDMALPSDYATLFLKPPKPFMWMSSGDTHSFLHRDDQDNINCQMFGKKSWFIVDKKYPKELYMSEKYSGYGERAPFDVHKVDLVTYPKMRNVPWFNVTLEAGDCLYLPGAWFHQVSSPPGRNIAINLWFWPPLKKFTSKGKQVIRKLTKASMDEVMDTVTSFDKTDVWTWYHPDASDVLPIEDEIKAAKKKKKQERKAKKQKQEL